MRPSASLFRGFFFNNINEAVRQMVGEVGLYGASFVNGLAKIEPHEIAPAPIADCRTERAAILLDVLKLNERNPPAYRAVAAMILPELEKIAAEQAVR